MLLTVLSYAMIIIFMYVIMKKKMSPFTSLVIIPLLFTLVAMISGASQKGNIGDFVLEGIKTTSNTGIMLLFAILYFSIMLDAGLFDPITKKMIYFAKGDPMKVLMATAIVAATVSLNGDGTTTTLICCSAFIPIYKKLIELRKNNEIVVYGSYDLILENNPSIFAYVRTYGVEKLLVIANFTAEECIFELPEDISYSEVELLIHNYDVENGPIENIPLRPYEAMVFKLK